MWSFNSGVGNLGWEQGEVLEDWRKALVVLLYKGKGRRDECNRYRGTSLLSEAGKLCRRVLTETKNMTEKSVGEKHVGFREGRGCADQIFALQMLIEKYIEKDRKLFVVFMDLERAYDKVDRKELWDV